jgi:hypothetical protein
MNWQPIETAPKDGTRFLAYQHIGETLGDAIQACQWISEQHPAYRGAHIVTTWDYDSFSGATHWMPLPEPPTANQP